MLMGRNSSFIIQKVSLYHIYAVDLSPLSLLHHTTPPSLHFPLRYTYQQASSYFYNMFTGSQSTQAGSTKPDIKSSNTTASLQSAHTSTDSSVKTTTKVDATFYFATDAEIDTEQKKQADKNEGRPSEASKKREQK